MHYSSYTILYISEYIYMFSKIIINGLLKEKNLNSYETSFLFFLLNIEMLS